MNALTDVQKAILRQHVTEAQKQQCDIGIGVGVLSALLDEMDGLTDENLSMHARISELEAENAELRESISRCHEHAKKHQSKRYTSGIHNGAEACRWIASELGVILERSD